jgi:hypothetical protein
MNATFTMTLRTDNIREMPATIQFRIIFPSLLQNLKTEIYKNIILPAVF